MTDKPDDQPSENASERPPLADQIRAKMDEYDVDRHLNELASTLEHAVRQGMAKAGEFAHEHRGDLERLIDKAAGAVDRRTEGKHADTIQQVRGSIERGVEKIADQRQDAAPGPAPGPASGPASEPASDPVPDPAPNPAPRPGPDGSGGSGSDVPPSNG